MKIGDLVRAKHPFLVGSLGIVVQFSESYPSSEPSGQRGPGFGVFSCKPSGHSDICIQWCVAAGRRSWTTAHNLELISEYR